VFKPGMFGVSLKEGFSSGTAGRTCNGVSMNDTVLWGQKMKGLSRKERKLRYIRNAK
jgi:hypothetical protein